MWSDASIFRGPSRYGGSWSNRIVGVLLVKIWRPLSSYYFWWRFGGLDPTFFGLIFLFFTSIIYFSFSYLQKVLQISTLMPRAKQAKRSIIWKTARALYVIEPLFEISKETPCQIYPRKFISLGRESSTCSTSHLGGYRQ